MPTHGFERYPTTPYYNTIILCYNTIPLYYYNTTPTHGFERCSTALYLAHPRIQIAAEMFSLSDGCTFSAKKDAIANNGGFFCCNSDAWAEEFKDLLILTEGS